MKQKIILRIAILAAFFIAIFAIGSISNKVYAAVPEGSLKITLNIDNGLRAGDIGISQFNSLQYKIRKSDNSLPEFDSEFESRNGVTIVGDDVIEIPKESWLRGTNVGDYYIVLTGIENGSYEVTNESAELIDYYNYEKPNSSVDYKSTYTQNETSFTINNDQVQVDADILVTIANDYYLYYNDYSGENPEVIFQYQARRGSETIYFNFIYSQDEYGNNVYTYSKNATSQNIKVKSGERTIVKNMPGTETGSYRVIIPNLSYGSKIKCYSRGMSGGYDANSRAFFSNWNSDTFPVTKDQGFYLECSNIKGVTQINKKAIDGTMANAKFKIQPDYASFNLGFKHYDTYNFQGNTYSNVYVLARHLPNVSQEISTIDGNATIICPLMYSEDGIMGYQAGNYKFFETDTDENLLYQTEQAVIVINGANYEVTSKYAGNDLKQALDNDPANFDYNNITNNINNYATDLSTVSVTNYVKPCVTKVVLDEDGNIDTSCEEEFEFELYDNEFNLIDTIQVKANEKEYFNVQWNDSSESNYYQPKSSNNNLNYYIVEKKKDGYICEDITPNIITGLGNSGSIENLGDEIRSNFNADVYEKGYVITPSNSSYVDLTFANTKIPTEEPSVTKIVLDLNGNIDTSCEEEFEFELYDNEFNLIDTIQVKANEKKYFNVQWINENKPNYYNLNNPENMVFYVVEKKKMEYTCESVTASSFYEKINIPVRGSILSIDDEIRSKLNEDVYEIGFAIEAVPTNYVNVTFTNKIALTEINGEKKWEDNNNEAGKRPGFITIFLKNKDEIIRRAAVEADTEGKWNYKFENLPKYENGEEIEYTIEEEAVDMYETIIEEFNITNIFRYKNITVTKEWDDSDDEEGLRPLSISVQLYGNEEPVGEPVEINDENGWTYTWEYLRTKLNNEEIEYTVKEIEIPEGYTVEVSGNEVDGYVIKNTHIIEEPEEEPEEEPQEEPQEEEPQEEEPQEEEPQEEEPQEEEPQEEEPQEEEPEEEPISSPVEQVQTGDKIMIFGIILIISTIVLVSINKYQKKNK